MSSNKESIEPSFSVSSIEYMEICTPLSASCIQDGIPMTGFFKGRNLVGWGCGHCGLFIYVNGKRGHDLTKID